MPIRCLSVVKYDAVEKTFDPTWVQIEWSIRLLDKECFPWIWLFIDEQSDDSTHDCMTVMGGDGVYWIAICAGEFDQLRLFDPNKGSHEVPLWTRDQGFADYEFHVTYDIDLVFRICRHFAATGKPLPEANWEN